MNQRKDPAASVPSVVTSATTSRSCLAAEAQQDIAIMILEILYVPWREVIAPVSGEALAVVAL
jgi:hypothetical protein